MENVYDMVSGQFIEDESRSQTEQQTSDSAENYGALNLQLQTVENSYTLKKHALPADLAYQTFLLTE